MTRAELRPIAAVTALAALLRFATLDVQSFWFDEAVTAGLLDRGFGDMLGEIPDSESTPPLYYVLAWVWAQAFGLGEVGLRSFSALIGTAVVPVAWLAARELVSRRAALAVAALAAVNPLLVWYSQEARSYALLLLLGTLSLWLCARLLRRRSGRDAALWGLISVLALATHYFAVFVIVAEAAVLLARAPGRRAVLAAIAGAGVLGACLLPLAITQEGGGYASFIASDPLLERSAKVAKQFLMGYDSSAEAVITGLAAAIATAGAALAVLRPDPGDRTGIAVAGTIGVAGLALPLVAALAGTDYLLTRNVILAWVPLAVVVGAGLAGARAGRAGLAGLVVLGGLMLAGTVGVPLERAWQRENWRGAAEAIGAPAPRAIVVTDPAAAVPIRLYRPRARRAPAGEVGDVVLIARRGRDLGGGVPAPPDPAALAALGLRRAGGRREATYELVRLQAVDGKVRLTREQLEALRLSPERDGAEVLFE
jgi:mannosyltransferase